MKFNKRQLRTLQLALHQAFEYEAEFLDGWKNPYGPGYLDPAVARKSKALLGRYRRLRAEIGEFMKQKEKSNDS